MADENSKKEKASEKEARQPLFNVIDRRLFTDLEHLDLDAIEPEKPRFPTYVEELQARMQETERRFEEKKRQMQDEIAKIRTRLEADLERRVEAERQRFVEPFLDILDNLERALAVADAGGGADGLHEGVHLTASLFRQRLAVHGIEPLTVLDQPFDPNVSEAIGVVEVDDPDKDGVVLDELRRGYRSGDRVLRPARVRVGHHRPSPGEPAASLKDPGTT
jgi:molecular chaperone GrpE